jgi:hypothetical protein
MKNVKAIIEPFKLEAVKTAGMTVSEGAPPSKPLTEQALRSAPVARRRCGLRGARPPAAIAPLTR